MLKKTHTEEVAVRDRFTNEVKFTATVECAPDALPSLKLGLAVKWGLANGADLRSADLGFADLRSADLGSADLRSADLGFADLRSADLRSADLRSAKYGDQVLVRLLARATRISDGYEAIAFEVEGGGVWIKGGCKWLSLADFRAKADAYDTDTRAETHEILDYIERAAVRLGAITPIKPARSRAKAIKAVQVSA